MTRQVEILIIGAGPAGLAAALEARRHGADVLVVDENPYPGGQIYRNVSHSPLADPCILGPDYLRGRALVDDFERSGIAYWPRTLAWQVTPERRVSLTRQCTHGEPGEGPGTLQLQAGAIIVATGAQERPFPVPGGRCPA